MGATIGPDLHVLALGNPLLMPMQVGKMLLSLEALAGLRGRDVAEEMAILLIQGGNLIASVL